MNEAQKTLFCEKKIIIHNQYVQPIKKKIVFKPYSQDQEFLLPKSLNDFVSQGHISRLISTIIDQMDTSYITATYKGGGTSAYDPKLLLKSWILGFIYKIYSCRLLAKNLRENLPFVWISGNQTPNFRTLNNFRLRLKEDIKKIFKAIVTYGLESGIIEGKDIFIDHSKKEANANKYKIVWKKQVEKQLSKIDAELDALFEYIDKVNDEEEEIFAGKDFPEQERKNFDKKKVQEIVNKINDKIKNKELSKEKAKELKKKTLRTQELQERKENYNKKKEILGQRNSYSKTDKDAVAMMMKDKITIRPAYNEGIAVENGLVLNYVISDNCGDTVSFIPLMNGVIENLNKNPENVNADGAYGNEESMDYLRQKRIGNYLKYGTYQKEKSKKWRTEKFRFEDFIYNKEKDEFICKNGIKLQFEKEFEEHTKAGYVKIIKKYRAEEGKCPSCLFYAQCTKAQARTIDVSWNGETLRQQARENLNSQKGIELRKRRGNEVESVFGDAKFNKNKKQYNLRGIEKVTLEAGLYYIAHNLRKIHQHENKPRKKLIVFETKTIISNPAVHKKHNWFAQLAPIGRILVGS